MIYVQLPWMAAYAPNIHTSHSYLGPAFRLPQHLLKLSVTITRKRIFTITPKCLSPFKVPVIITVVSLLPYGMDVKPVYSALSLMVLCVRVCACVCVCVCACVCVCVHVSHEHPGVYRGASIHACAIQTEKLSVTLHLFARFTCHTITHLPRLFFNTE